MLSLSRELLLLDVAYEPVIPTLCSMQAGMVPSALATDAKMKVALRSLTLVWSSDDAPSEFTMFVGILRYQEPRKAG